MNVGELQRKLSVWATQDKGRKFHALYALLHDEDWLLLAHDYVSQNAGSVTAGCDGITMANFDVDLEDNLRCLADDLRSGAFEARPVRRVRIPKPSGKLRPLGIPAIRDRIVQEALRMVLEPIFEADFVQHSYGFRPCRRTMDAVKCILWAACEPRKFFWVIEGDIASYFDTIHHRKLIKLLRRRIADERLLNLIWKFLRAGVMERNVLRATVEGTPQGGIISPLLANIYLHELDKYMERYTALSLYRKAKRRKQGLANFAYVRYADDFVVMCNGTRAQAEALKAELTEFLRDRLRLTLSQEKTRVTHLNDGFEFLGFRFRRGPSKTGGMVTRSLIPKGKARDHLGKLKAITAPDTCQDSVVNKLRALNRLIRGWCQYYQYTGNVSTVFPRLGNRAYWLLGHWLGGKFKTKIKRAMQPFWQENHLSVGKTRLRLHHEFSRQVYKEKFHRPNPYVYLIQLRREELPSGPVWLGNEARPGQADLRVEVLARDGYQCRFCKAPINEDTCHLHHVRDVRVFKRPADANTAANSVALCIPCHKRETAARRQRQLESRVL